MKKAENWFQIPSELQKEVNLIRKDAESHVRDSMSSWFFKDELSEVDLEWFLPQWEDDKPDQSTLNIHIHTRSKQCKEALSKIRINDRFKLVQEYTKIIQEETLK